MPETITTENTTCAPAPTGEAFEKHWFCAAIRKDGTVLLQDSDSPSFFLETLQTSLLAWVDYRTSNFEKDVRTSAEMLGFNPNLTG